MFPSTSTLWTELDPMAQVGGPSSADSDDVTTGQLGQAAVSGSYSPLQAAISPEHPLFWFLVAAGATLGLIGSSTHLRVGPFKVGASAGKGD